MFLNGKVFDLWEGSVSFVKWRPNFYLFVMMINRGNIILIHIIIMYQNNCCLLKSITDNNKALINYTNSFSPVLYFLTLGLVYFCNLLVWQNEFGFIFKKDFIKLFWLEMKWPRGTHFFLFEVGKIASLCILSQQYQFERKKDSFVKI